MTSAVETRTPEAGRGPAAAAVRTWLGDVLRPRLCVITGAPAAGKSRLAAWIAAEDLRTDRAVHGMFSARGMDLHAATWALAEQLSMPGADPETLTAFVSLDRRPATVVIGELDESGVRCDGAAAHDIITRLLNPLLQLQHVRLLVEGRPEVVNAFDAPAEVVHLDDPARTDRAAFTAWVHQTAASRGVTDPAVIAAADALYPNAGLAELALVGGGPDPVAGWFRRVPQEAWPALQALASAYSPLDHPTWRRWTTALVGDPGRADQSLAAAAPLVTRIVDRYTLHCRPLRDAVLKSRTPELDAQVDNAIGYTLYDSLPKTPGGAPDWANTPPYAERHILRHAAASGVAERMLADVGCAVHADPVSVTIAVNSAADKAPDGLVRAWRTAGRALIASEDAVERAAILRAGALHVDDAELARRLEAWSAAAPWQVQWCGTRPAAPDGEPWPGPVTALTVGAGEHAGALVAASVDGTLRLLSPADGAPVGRIACRTSEPRGLVALSDGTVVHVDQHGAIGRTKAARAQSRADAIVSLLNAEPGGNTGPDFDALVAALASQASSPPTALGADHGVHVVAAGDRSGGLRCWTLDATPLHAEQTKPHDGPVTAVACLRGDNGAVLVVSGGADGTVRLWNPADDALDEPAARRDVPVNAVAAAMLPSGPAVAIGWADGDIWFWDLVSGRELTLRLGFPANALAMDDRGVLFVGSGHGVTAVRVDVDRLPPPPDQPTDEESAPPGLAR